MKMSFGELLVGFIVVGIAITGSAADSDATPEGTAGAIQVGATPIFVFSLNDFCRRDNDMILCSTGLYTAGFQVDAHYRFPFEWLGLGLVGGVHSELNHAESCVSDSGCTGSRNAIIWRCAVDARFYPLVRRRAALWLAIEGGVVGAGRGAFSEVTGETGLGLGFDVSLTRYLIIGFDVRALFFAFGKAPVTTPNGDRVQMTNSVWVSLGLITLSGRFPLSR